MSKEALKIPKHVAIIMDGNRRWARERNLPTLDGHKKGYDQMKCMPEWFFAQGVEIVTVYAFSTENWNRGRDEVNYLMALLRQALKDDFEEFNERGYQLLISGRISELPGDLPDICLDAMANTRDNKRGIFNICLNYGGRAEIVDAVKKMISNGITIDQVHEGMLRKYFYHGDLPDPDMIVRTSGEQRLSGFLLWQSAYAELLFMHKHWPDFEKSDADKVLAEYANRQRRFGANG